MLPIVTALVAAVFVAITYAALKTYHATHNRRFLILGCGVLIWPIVGISTETALGVAVQQVRQGNVSALLSRILDSGYSIGDVFAIWTYTYWLVSASLIVLGLVAIYRAVSTSAGLNPYPRSR